MAISKKGTVFTSPAFIEPLADKIFTNLQAAKCYVGYDHEKFVKRLDH